MKSSPQWVFGCFLLLCSFGIAAGAVLLPQPPVAAPVKMLASCLLLASSSVVMARSISRRRAQHSRVRGR